MQCGVDLSPGWHADHIDPFSLGGETDMVNGQALCAPCNLKKGARMDVLSVSTEAFEETLRAWQVDAIREYDRVCQTRPDFLAVATPGAGKTKWARAILRRLIDARVVTQVVVVVPTDHLKIQWADVLDEAGIPCDPRWSASDGAVGPAFIGVCVTYGAVASGSLVLRKLCAQGPTAVILDEVHHCGDQRTWGQSIRVAFEPATRRICLSGTPFRSDNNAIPFVRYVDGQGQADYAYGYGEAVRDGICRAVVFPRRGGIMEWADATGALREASFDDKVSEQDASRRLRTALLPTGEWISEVLTEANARLMALRAEEDRRAGGLVLAIDCDHARAIHSVLRRISGTEATLVVSDEAERNAIEKFANADTPWIVAVRMVSEGVDIPRLRVGVYATNVVTELFFRQAVGRLLRGDDVAFFFIPDDPDLRRFAQVIKEEREHNLREEEHIGGTPPTGPGPTLFPLFKPISSTATNSGAILDANQLTADEIRIAAELLSIVPGMAKVSAEQVALLRRLMLHLDGERPNTGMATASSRSKEPTHKQVAALRSKNNQAVASIAYKFGVDYADVQRTLNAAVGVNHIGRCSLDQLGRRLELALKWRMTGDIPHGA